MERPWLRRGLRPHTWRDDLAPYDRGRLRSRPFPAPGARRYPTSVLLPSILSSRLLLQAAIAAAILLLVTAAMQLPYGLGQTVRQRVAELLRTDTDIAAVAAVVQRLAEEGRSLRIGDFALDAPLLPALRPQESLQAPDDTTWVWPVDGDIDVPFGWVHDPDSGRTRFHDGVLFQVHAATVAAAGDGVVRRVDAEDDGFRVLIEHAHGWESVYAPLDPLEVAVGRRVQAGDVLGRVAGFAGGGDEDGARFYFALLRDGNHVDPASALLHR